MRAYRFANMQIAIVFLLLTSLSAYGFYLYYSWQGDSDASLLNPLAPVAALWNREGGEKDTVLLPASTEEENAPTAGELLNSHNNNQEAAIYRLDRERQRSATQEELKLLLEDKNLSGVQRDTLQNKLVKLYEEAELELRVEQLLQSKGFAGAVFIRGEQLNTVIVHQKDLSAAESIQIAELVARAVGIKADDVVIIERSSGT